MINPASSHKIIYHRDKLLSYLRGESIFPATLELDLRLSVRWNVWIVRVAERPGQFT